MGLWNDQLGRSQPQGPPPAAPAAALSRQTRPPLNPGVFGCPLCAGPRPLAGAVAGAQGVRLLRRGRPGRCRRRRRAQEAHGVPGGPAHRGGDLGGGCGRGGGAQTHRTRLCTLPCTGEGGPHTLASCGARVALGRGGAGASAHRLASAINPGPCSASQGEPAAAAAAAKSPAPAAKPAAQPKAEKKATPEKRKSPAKEAKKKGAADDEEDGEGDGEKKGGKGGAAAKGSGAGGKKGKAEPAKGQKGIASFFAKK